MAATNTFLQAFDTVAGGGGNDTLVLGENGAGVLDAAFAGVTSVETLRVTNGNGGSIYSLGALASAAGVNTITIQGAGQTVETNGFVTALTVNGTATGDIVNVNLANAGAKALNLGAGDDTVNVTQITDAAAGSVQVNFASGSVGDGTNANATIVGPNGSITVNDEGTLITNVTNNVSVFNVVGLGADGAVDAAQNRGNFARVQLGTSADNTVNTTAAGVGDVYINAGAGNDTLTANSAGNHFLVGGAGNDTITLDAAGNSSVIAGAGNDLVFINPTATGQNSVVLTSGTNILTMANGTLRGTIPALADTLTGGSDTDTLRITATDATGYLTPSTRSISGFETLSLTTNLQATPLTVANIQQGITTVVLEAGTIGLGSRLNLEAGARTVVIGTAANTALGLAAGGLLGADLTVAAATGTADVLTLVNGNAAAEDAFNNGRTVTALGYETVNLNTGAAATALQVGNLTLRGTANSTDGGAAADNSDALSLVISGANAFRTSVDANTDGVVSVDASALTAQATGVTFELFPSTVRDGTAEATLVIGALNVIGSAGADSINGSDGNDTINGGAGNDAIDGGFGNNVLNGGAGNSTITGSTGNDTIVAESGIHEIQTGDGVNSVTAVLGVDAANVATQSTVTGGTGNDTITLTGDGRVGVNANAGNNIITLTGNGNATIQAGGGDDQLTVVGNGNLTVNLGAGSNQTSIQGTGTKAITGGTGVDVVNIVGAGNATVTGDAGADIISTGTGRASVTGGAGDDTIALGAASNTVILGATLAANGLDSVIGFTGGALASGGDVINARAFTFDGNGMNTIATLANIAAITAANVATNNIIVLTDDTVTAITAADIAIALNAGDIDTTATIADRLLVLDAGNELRVFRINNTTAANDNSVVVEQLATLVGVTDIAATTFVAANFITAT